MKKQYTGTVYIGVVGPELDIGVCRDSINNIVRRPGDAFPSTIRATKGYEARQLHLNNFIESKHDFLLLLDHDMVFQPDALERLRSHSLPFVSGLYMRRNYAPVVPVWYRPYRGQWPMEPWLDPIPADTLHPLGASGWGCILLHREVVEAVRRLLKGEDDIIEDDMDVWPYDLPRLMTAVNGLRELVETKPPVSTLRAALETHVTALTEELRPLRGRNDIIGSDIRYPFYALQAGYQLVGDPQVRCGHIINYPVSPDDYDNWPLEHLGGYKKKTAKLLRSERAKTAESLGVLK